MFPHMLIAKPFGFTRRDFLVIDDADRAVPKLGD
jgi:hypothetical protein